MSVSVKLDTFSPHAWGWTSSGRSCCCGRCVFPTRVGVDLYARRMFAPAASFPHTRGGGPMGPALDRLMTAFSPHAWGWTVDVSGVKTKSDVFPTRVGVDRFHQSASRGKLCFPHTRGGGPGIPTRLAGLVMFSPHAWGWTTPPDEGRMVEIVFPTRVGVDHVRKTLIATGKPFSPHAWGWTYDACWRGNSATVFPTRVGVDLFGYAFATQCIGFPHTRGGGPEFHPLCAAGYKFSPHAWGWT